MLVEATKFGQATGRSLEADGVSAFNRLHHPGKLDGVGESCGRLVLGCSLLHHPGKLDGGRGVARGWCQLAVFFTIQARWMGSGWRWRWFRQKARRCTGWVQ